MWSFIISGAHKLCRVVLHYCQGSQSRLLSITFHRQIILPSPYGLFVLVLIPTIAPWVCPISVNTAILDANPKEAYVDTSIKRTFARQWKDASSGLTLALGTRNISLWNLRGTMAPKPKNLLLHMVYFHLPMNVLVQRGSDLHLILPHFCLFLRNPEMETWCPSANTWAN